MRPLRCRRANVVQYFEQRFSLSTSTDSVDEARRLVVGSAESGTFAGRSVVKNGKNQVCGQPPAVLEKERKGEKESEKKKAGDTINKKK